MKYLKIKGRLTDRTQEEKIRDRSGEEFQKHVMRYGIILLDDRRESETGFIRYVDAHINNMIASFKMVNGEVKEWGLSVGNTKIDSLNTAMAYLGENEYRVIYK